MTVEIALASNTLSICSQLSVKISNFGVKKILLEYQLFMYLCIFHQITRKY